MKNTILYLAFLVLVFSACTTSRKSDPILLRLDEVIGERQSYIDSKEAKIAHLKDLYAVAEGEKQYLLCAEIYDLYNGFNTDSAIHYSNLGVQLASRLNNAAYTQEALINQARCLSINGMYDRAKTLLLPLEEQLDSANRIRYYQACSSMYIWESLFTTLPEEQAEAWSHVAPIRRKIIACEPDPVWRTQEEALLLADSTPREALSLLLPILRSLPESDDNIRFISNSVGSCYARLNRSDSALHYFAISAISDMEHGIMEHASLREVALILFRCGDVERAYRYMRCCIEDAELCKARLRTIEMAGDMPVILEAYHGTIRDQHRRLKISIIVLIAFAVLMVVLLIYTLHSVHKMRKARTEALNASQQLREANVQLQTTLSQLQALNLSLEESNRIRATYVTQYMRECSETIGKLEQYHKTLLRVATHSNYQKLLEAVKSTDFIDDNTKEFYQHFDDTFLSLFPHFIEDFNRLLREEERFNIEGIKRLSTELRIFALIRLGVTDSEDIARFLRHSTKTIYNYRAAVRNRALGDRNLLEQAVMKL